MSYTRNTRKKMNARAKRLGVKPGTKLTPPYGNGVSWNQSKDAKPKG